MKNFIIFLSILGLIITLSLNKCSKGGDNIPPSKVPKIMISPDKVLRVTVSKEWSDAIKIPNWENLRIIANPQCLLNIKIKGDDEKIKIFKFINLQKNTRLGNFNFNEIYFKIAQNSKPKKTEVTVFFRKKF